MSPFGQYQMLIEGVKKMKFNTHYDRIRQAPEKNSGEKLVETAGYIPAKKRIENLMLAGLHLKEYRMEQFDFHENQVDETYFDRTRSKNFDLSDVSSMRRELEERSKEKIREAKERKAQLEASQTIIEAPQTASKTEKAEKSAE